MTLLRHTPPNFCRGSVMRALAPHWATLLALTLFLVAGLAVRDDYGLRLDEARHRDVWLQTADYVKGDSDALPTHFYNLHRYYGTVFQAVLALPESAFGLQDSRGILLSRYLLTHLVFLTGGLFAYLLALRLLRNRPAALLAAALFLLHPRLYAHSFVNTQDIPFAAAFVIALYLTHRAYARGTTGAFILLGAAVGVLVNTRVMGIILLGAIPAMQALDLAAARGGAERKRTLVTSAGFALAFALAFYVSFPNLWADPIGRLAEWPSLLSHLGGDVEPQLFQSELYSREDFLPEYLSVWFSITSPPFALALGAIGASWILARCMASPLHTLRSRSLRFGLLLVGCFGAPPLAVILLDLSVYNGWRHYYFLWGPFALMGAFGLLRLASALRRARFRAAVYAATVAGLATAAASVALIHPNQQVYFNALVDRVTPERLRTEYAMDYSGHSVRQGLEWVVEHSAQPSAHPPPITAIQTLEAALNMLILPESARERLANAPRDFVWAIPTGSWSRSARELHRVKVYGNTLRIVESRDDLSEVSDAVRGKEPLIDAAFDVHRIDGALALVMEPCAPGFVERVSVTLRAFPVDAGDLPAWREGKAFEPHIFYLMNYGAHFEGKCAASLPLPAYPIADIQLRWSLELLADGEAREKARRARDDGRLLARAAHRSAYDIYLADGELAYVNDSCNPLETERPFHLNVYPENASDLPEARREQGFERFHFEFLLNGAFADGGCAAFFPLPDYPVAAVRTGQHDGEGGDLWLAEFWIDPERRWAESASGASGEPVARGNFDVHLTDEALVYVKEPCEPADVDARFFLHIVPERAGDLPDERREHGFDNLDFAFFPDGALFEGKCAARAALPEYPVESVRTGQYLSGVGEIWRAEFAAGR